MAVTGWVQSTKEVGDLWFLSLGTLQDCGRYAYEITMGQFLNSEQTNLYCLNAGRKANSVIHKWLFQGDALLILTDLLRYLLCLMMWEGARPGSAESKCVAAFQTYMWVYVHVPCTPPRERLPRSAEWTRVQFVQFFYS